MVPFAPRPAEPEQNMDPAQKSDDPDDPDQQSSAEAGAPLLELPFPRAAPPLQSRAEQKLFTPAFVRLLGMQSASGFAFSMFFLLPKYLATLGESPSRIGFVMGGFGVACILTIPLLGPLVARFGRRGALVAATSLLAAAALTFALVPDPGVMAIPLRASEGVTWTIMFSTALALTAEIAPPDRLAQAIGLAGAASLIMNAVAPAIGEPLADHFGYRSVFLLAAAAALAAALLARRLIVADPSAFSAHPTPKIASSVTSRADERAGAPRLAMYVVFAVSGLAFSVLFTFLAPFALAHGVKAIRSFFIAYTASALAVRILGGRLADRLGHRAIACRALLLYGCVVASTGLLGPHHLAVLGLLFGLAHGAVFPALMALLIHLAPPARRPRILGIANGAMSVGISSVFPAGMLVVRVGYPAMFAAAGVLVALSSTLLRKGGPLGR